MLSLHLTHLKVRKKESSIIYERVHNKLMTYLLLTKRTKLMHSNKLPFYFPSVSSEKIMFTIYSHGNQKQRYI